MKKELVYLFEMDSVSKTLDEILHGQQAMYDAIVNQGKCVVLSFNQLTDALVFLAPISSPRTDYLKTDYLALFHNESLKIARYIDSKRNTKIRTAAQYVINSLEDAIGKEETSSSFIFSSLPIKKSNKAAMEIVLNSIKNNDLGILEELPDVSGPDIAYFRRYVKFILDLSALSSCYIAVKETPHFLFCDYMDMIFTEEASSIFGSNIPDNYANALQILNDTKPKADQNPNARSSWITNMENLTQPDAHSLGLAKEILNICYNFSVEGSICGIEKAYHTDRNAFIRAFRDRISQFSKIPDTREEKVLTIEPDMFLDWEYAVRITDAAQKVKSPSQTPVSPKVWNCICRKGQWKKFASTLWFFAIFLVVEVAFGFAEGCVDEISHNWINAVSEVERTKVFFYLFVKTGVITTAVCYASSKFSENHHIPDITKIIHYLHDFAKDIIKLITQMWKYGKDEENEL